MRKITFIIITIFCIFFIQTIAYSALNSTMKISGNAYVRVETDVRITDFEIEKTNNALSNYAEFSKNTITTGITLNSDSSSIVYSVEVSNYNSNNIGIYFISGLPEELTYSITDYTVGSDSLIDGIGKKTFYLIISGPAGSYDISLDFEFRSVYSITYDGISGSYQSSIMEGDNLSVTFTDISNKINIFVDGTEMDRSTYSYDNTTGVLSYQNINGNLVISKAESTLIEGRTFSATLKNFVNGTTDLVYNSTDTTVTYIGIFEEEIPSGYTEETFFTLPSIEVSENGRVKAYRDNGKVYIYSIDDILAPSDSYSLFRGYTNLTELELSELNTKNLLDMGAMFQDLTSLEYLDISTFNVKNVYRLFYTFTGCKSLKSINFPSFKQNKISNLQHAFADCQSLETLDLSGWNIQNVTNLSHLFANCYKLSSINLSGWDTSNVTDMTYMFRYNKSLVTLDISMFNTSNVTDMTRMFGYCDNLKNIYVGDGWTTENVTSSESMFSNTPLLPNFNSDYVDKTYAYAGGDGLGYLSYLPE